MREIRGVDSAVRLESLELFLTLVYKFNCSELLAAIGIDCRTESTTRIDDRYRWKQ